VVVLIAAGTGILVAEIAGHVSARRVSRIRPAAALHEASAERHLIHPVRLMLGLCALGGGVTLGILMIKVSFSMQLTAHPRRATALCHLELASSNRVCV
jgi:hypothetical protein